MVRIRSMREMSDSRIVFGGLVTGVELLGGGALEYTRTPEALEAVADAAALFADSEGLHGHAVSATARREGGAK